MPRNLSLGRAGRPVRSLGSVICLLFVVSVAVAFWAGVVWMGRMVLAAAGLGL